MPIQRSLKEMGHCKVMLQNVMEASSESILESAVDMKADMFVHEDAAEARSLGIQYVANSAASAISAIAKEVDVDWECFVRGLSDTNLSEIQFAINQATK